MTHRQKENNPISLNKYIYISSLNLASLWHKTLGHTNKSCLHEVQSASQGIGCFDASALSLCPCCLKEKQYREKFPKVGATRAQELLEILHSDICDHVWTSTFLGCTHFSHSLMTSPTTQNFIFSHTNPKSYKKFQEYKIEMENQISKKIIVLKCDNGGECKSLNYNLFSQTHGIRCQFTTPYTLQQNGVNERKNQTL